MKKSNLLLWRMKKKLRQTIFILMSSGFFMSPETRIYLHMALHPLHESSHPSRVLRAVCHPLLGWARTSSRARTLDRLHCPEHSHIATGHRQADGPFSVSLPFSAVPVPARCGGTAQPPPRGREEVGRARHMPEVFRIWHDGTPPPSLPPSVCSPASRLLAPVPDVLSQAPRGSWKQKMLLPLATAKPARVPAGKS